MKTNLKTTLLPFLFAIAATGTPALADDIDVTINRNPQLRREEIVLGTCYDFPAFDEELLAFSSDNQPTPEGTWSYSLAYSSKTTKLIIYVDELNKRVFEKEVVTTALASADFARRWDSWIHTRVILDQTAEKAQIIQDVKRWMKKYAAWACTQ